jgi:hypothetical protein
MPDDSQNKPNPSDDRTIPSRADIRITPDNTMSARSASKPLSEKAEKALSTPGHSGDISHAQPTETEHELPWTLQQFFSGEIDLYAELSERFPNMPLMSTFHKRSLGTKRGVATLGMQDGSAAVMVETDSATKILQLSFTYSSMLTLRFRYDDLSNDSRAYWLENMRREAGGRAFLGGQSRYERDLLICFPRKYFTNLYAFSPNHFEAAARLTPEVTRKLLDWLESYWKPDAPGEDAPRPLTTW